MRRKGFTLIELLAVIVVLAVIAMITTPIVFGIINTAKKGAAEQSTVAYVKAIESTVTIDDFYDKSYANRDDYLYDEIKAAGKVTPPTAKTLKYTGTAQELVNAGSSTTGQIQYKAGTTGTYSTKIPTGTDVGTYTVYYKVVGDSNHNDVAERSLNVTIKPTGPTKVKSTSTDTHKGIVYLDPTNLKNSCNALNSVVGGTGIKTGCMKWYIYSEDNNSYTMILDHNIEERMSYSTGMSNLTNQKLKWDNSLKIRMIQANEIAKITGNTSWSTSKGLFYLDSNNKTPVANSTNKSKYAWLFDYIYNCEYGGCNIEESESSSAYFTGTEANSNMQYLIASDGSLRAVYKSGMGFGRGVGIRPVITISKSIIS